MQILEWRCNRAQRIVLRTFIRSSSRAHVLVRVRDVMCAHTRQCRAQHHCIHDVHISMMNGCKTLTDGRASTTRGKQKQGRKGREKKERAPDAIYYIIDGLASIAFNAFAPPISAARVATNKNFVASAATVLCSGRTSRLFHHKQTWRGRERNRSLPVSSVKK